MGRQQYLNRLAFGRSAFEDPEPVIEAEQRPQEDGDDGEYRQQYDSKGRPVNPAVDAIDAELRKAQNEVLELVGVVERKDQSDRATEVRNRASREQRQALLFAENDNGEVLEYTLSPISFFSHLWAESILQRVHVGFYDTSRSMWDIIASECRAVRTASGNQRLAMILPGLGDTIAHLCVRMPLILAAEQIVGRLQTYFSRRCKSRKSRERMYTALIIGFQTFLAAIDIALLPMEFHCSAQRLGLAPQLPLIPPLKAFLPWHRDSFHRFGWLPLLGLTSPVGLLLFHKALHYDADEEKIPICSLFTSFRYPTIAEHPTSSQLTPLERPALREDPLGWLLHQTWSARTSLMQRSGWNVVKMSTRPRDDEFENNTTLHWDYDDIDTKPPPVHRSTALAHLPAQYLASIIDCFFIRLLTLPFESFMLRSIAQSFMSSSTTTKTAQGISAAAYLYTPLGGGPFGALFRSPLSASSWTSAGFYLSRLGLAIALTTSIDAIIFFGVYKATKYVGRKYFQWGRGETGLGSHQTRRERLLSQGSNASAS
ncbi:hypothetical protein CLAFUW4_10079 [Fulvia fulva]|uniref:Uncharacterized protein n=1 Tax=Passalora fulva TaxID=5499 RepID=A0A9Q8UUQ6_PASFU|nr:uncharacterized protein CLAFUR5_12166 [Fulvia fulva]KAK4615295.1 hypothetical protein CLAFUR4_10083 [Fulvia fulva]KAK4617045.1 hypothetical protein CLAFUR0_10081 [Fulvia fulva]UJO23214.1 hypothetical protein CLAFUR5_12166 [Fulvia fulva]WPV19390.1 hypothetical protein CLAFUW4_10079 [Fulvia fulva]WPV34440.1 hypothetical protein CLAFUW7_10080 [Fulvia fulva]